MDATTRLTLFVEGPDHSGKSTIIPNLRRLLDHKAQVWERWIGTDFVYNAIRENASPLDVAAWPRQFGETAREALIRWYRGHPGLIQVVLIPSAEILIYRAAQSGLWVAEVVELNLHNQCNFYRGWAEYCRHEGFPTIVLNDGHACRIGEYEAAINGVLMDKPLTHAKCGNVARPWLVNTYPARAHEIEGLSDVVHRTSTTLHIQS